MNETELILNKIRGEFEHRINMHHEMDEVNIWVMAAAIASQSKDMEKTFTVRLVLRTTDMNGMNPYVDGTELFMIVDEENQTVVFVREDLWIDGPPIFHGGTVPDALAWMRQLAEPFYIQLRDPFLTPEQRIALNGHDEDYKLPDSQDKQKPSVPDPDDLDKYF